MARVRIGEMLLNQGRIDTLQLESALANQKQWGGRLGQAIVRLGFLAEDQVLEAVGTQIGVPFVVIGRRDVPAKVLNLLPRKLILSRKVLPLELQGAGGRGPLVVAFADPADLLAVDDIAFAAGRDVRPVLASDWDLAQAISRHLGTPEPLESVRPREVELPADTSPLSGAKKKGVLH